MITILIKGDTYLAVVEKFLVTVFAGILTLILMGQVILRYGFSRPLFWAEEICVQLLVFMTLFGLSILLKEKRMIAIDFVMVCLPEKLRKGIGLLMQISGLCVVLFFAYEATLWILRPAVRMEVSPTTGLAVWINYATFPLAFYGMTVHMMIGLLEMIASFRKRET